MTTGDFNKETCWIIASIDHHPLWKTCSEKFERTFNNCVSSEYAEYGDLLYSFDKVTIGVAQDSVRGIVRSISIFQSADWL